MEEPLRSFRFCLRDQENGARYALQSVTIDPTGHLFGPGRLIIRSAVLARMREMLMLPGPRDMVLDVWTSRQALAEPAEVAFYLRGVRTHESTSGPIRFNAVSDDYVSMELTMPYHALQFAAGSALEHLAAQAEG